MIELVASTDPTEHHALCYLCPLLRLLSTCELMTTGELGAIDAVLGTPLLLIEDTIILNEMESLAENVQEIICLSLWHSINWCREVVNSFCVQADPMIQHKVVQRVFNLCELEQKLERIIDTCPTFSPPGCVDFPMLSLSSSKDGSLTKKGPASSSLTSKQQQSPRLLALKASYRSFHPNVVGILSFSTLSDHLTHSTQIQALHTELMKIEVLSAVKLLSEEMLKHISVILNAKPKSKNPFFAKKKSSPSTAVNYNSNSGFDKRYDVITILELYVEKAIPAFFKHIQFYRKDVSETSPAASAFGDSNDENMDPSSDHEASEQDCTQSMILDIMKCYFEL